MKSILLLKLKGHMSLINIGNYCYAKRVGYFIMHPCYDIGHISHLPLIENKIGMHVAALYVHICCLFDPCPFKIIHRIKEE